MYGYLTYDKQFNLIDSIVKSTDEIIPVLKKRDDVDTVIKSTFTMILDFLEKLLGKLPEVLLSKKNLGFYKDELIVSLDRVKILWKMYPTHKDLLLEEWFLFAEVWKTFQERAKDVVESDKTIFLSLN